MIVMMMSWEALTSWEYETFGGGFGPAMAGITHWNIIRILFGF